MRNHVPRVRRNASLVRVALALMLSAAIYAAGGVDPSTLDNKVLIGYQGWFTCPEDGSQRWTHWSRGVPAADQNGAVPPSISC